jgi:hypothetical protein
MSSPFPLEDQAGIDRAALYGGIDIAKLPANPHWYTGMGFTEDTAYLGPFYRVLEAAGNGAAKGEAMLAGLAHYSGQGLAAAAAGEAGGDGEEFTGPNAKDPFKAIEDDARERVQLTTPDPATTGSAVQLVHGLVSSFTRVAIGGLAGACPVHQSSRQGGGSADGGGIGRPHGRGIGRRRALTRRLGLDLGLAHRDRRRRQCGLGRCRSLCRSQDPRRERLS